MPTRSPTPCTYCGAPAVSRGRCARHSRPSTDQRGYDQQHKDLRGSWEPAVATGTVHCARCRQLINPTDDWDLGHTNDRSRYSGPEHSRCNRAAAARMDR